jgi:hypothetical protein
VCKCNAAPSHQRASRAVFEKACVRSGYKRHMSSAAHDFDHQLLQVPSCVRVHICTSMRRVKAAKYPTVWFCTPPCGSDITAQPHTNGAHAQSSRELGAQAVLCKKALCKWSSNAGSLLSKMSHASDSACTNRIASSTQLQVKNMPPHLSHSLSPRPAAAAPACQAARRCRLLKHHIQSNTRKPISCI